MWGIRASFLPAIPGTSAFHELNVRTYVHHQGVPSVLFLSLDAASRLAVWGARKFYHLPYFNAQMSLDQTGKTDSVFIACGRIVAARQRNFRRRGPSASPLARLQAKRMQTGCLRSRLRQRFRTRSSFF